MENLTNFEYLKTKEREAFFYVFSYVGVTATTLFAIVNVLGENSVVGFLELICAFFAVINILFYKRVKNYNYSTSVIMVIMIVILSIMLITGGMNKTGIFWIYTFPVLSFFLKGKREGLLWIGALWAVFFTITAISFRSDFFHIAYELIEVRQAFASFIAASVMVYFYERTVFNYKRAVEDKNRELYALNNSLEERVVEEVEKRYESEKLFQSVFDNSPIGIGISDNEGNVQKLNPTAEKILGFKDEKFNFLDRTSTKEREKYLKNFISLAKGETDSFFITKNYLNKKGREIPVELNVFSIRNENGGVENIVRFFTDITEKIEREERGKKQESLIIQQSKMASMGELLGDISHHWRQPLNILGLMLQNVEMNLEYETPDKSSIKKIIDDSMSVISNMSKTIDDFGKYFKPETGEVEFNILKVLDSTIEILSNEFTENKIELKRDFNLEESQNYSYYGYSSGLKQVFLHVLHNAVDALVQSDERDREIRVKATFNQREIILTIEDNGKGVKEEHLERIFEPYFTTKYKSRDTGISLYMSKIIIEKNMNGKIELKNKRDGTLLIITLPVSKK